MLLLPRTDRRFDEFGKSRLFLKAPPMGELAPRADDAQTRRLLRESCPRRPGVYGMIDRQGQLAYVGKAKRLRDRLVTYFQKQSDDAKAARIAQHAVRVVWEPAPHEFPALLRELELIRRWRPQFNVQGQPDRFRKAYLCQSAAAAPHFYLAPAPPKGCRVVYGPLPARRSARRAVLRLNQHFRLRDCPNYTPFAYADWPDLFDRERRPQCLRFDMQTCLAPCAAGCTTKQYQAQVTAARRFLEGADEHTLARLETDMLAASAARQFERAALLRDTWQDLAWLQSFLLRQSEVRRQCMFIYPLPSYTRGQSWYMIRQGRLAGVTPKPTRQRAVRCLERLENGYASDALARKSAADDDYETMKIIGGWFRKHPQELLRTLPAEEAIAACRELVEDEERCMA